MKYLFAIICPPVSVLLCGKGGQFILNCILTLFGWIPGIVHALCLCASTDADSRNEKLIAAIRETGGWSNMPPPMPSDAQPLTTKRGLPAILGVFAAVVVSFVAIVVAFSKMKSLPQVGSLAPAEETKPVNSHPTIEVNGLKNWTANDGRVIQAKFIKLEGEAVIIEKDAKQFTVPFAKLNAASVEQARKLSVAPSNISGAADVGNRAPQPFVISTVTVAELPKKVHLKSGEEFPASSGSGKVTAPAGALVDVVSRSGEILRVSFLGGSKDLHYSKTSFEADVQAARERAAQAVLEAQAKEKLAQAKAEQEERERKAASETPQAKINAYWSVLKSDPFAMKLVKDVAVEHANGGLWYATVTVTNLWHIRNKQLRLQDAQNLWQLWAVLVSKKDPDKARMKLVDLNGNEVGGTSMIGNIWVQD